MWKSAGVCGKGAFGAGSLQGCFRAPLVWSWWNSTGWLTSGCPPSRTLLRKRHRQQPRQQRACRRESKDSPSQPVSLLSEQVEGRGSAVAPLRCSVYLFLFCPLSSLSSLLPVCFCLCFPCLAAVRLPFPGENRLRNFRVFADSRLATCGAQKETRFGFGSRSACRTGEGTQLGEMAL